MEGKTRFRMHDRGHMERNPTGSGRGRGRQQRPWKKEVESVFFKKKEEKRWKEIQKLVEKGVATQMSHLHSIEASGRNWRDSMTWGPSAGRT